MHWLKSYGVCLLTAALLISGSESSAQEILNSKFKSQKSKVESPNYAFNIQHSTFSIQHSAFNIHGADSVRIYPYNKSRVKWIAAANIVGYSGTMTALYSAWYKNYPQSSFHVFNDAAEWKQMDKLGHVYSAYAEGKASMEMWRWTGIDRKKRIWLGGMSGAAYQTVIEVLDGFSAQWGWSWADFGANILGSGMLVAQELAWDEQRIQMKWSFNRKRYDDPELNARSKELFGYSSLERFLKDYNGQTYWLSTGIQPIFPKSNIPAWLQISVGTGVEGILGARRNFSEKDGTVSFNRPDVKRVRQWYLAPDVDLTRIKTRKKGIRMMLDMLNVIKFPAPALELSDGKLRWNWIAF
jgi:hypothetical protein